MLLIGQSSEANWIRGKLLDLRVLPKKKEKKDQSQSQGTKYIYILIWLKEVIFLLYAY